MYVPLRAHGHHSLLTGVDSPETLLERAAALGLPALALADVDSGAGWTDFLQAAASETGQPPVRPIVAAELSDGGERPGRLIALVENETGYRNLCRLISIRQLGYDPGAALPEDADERAAELARRERGPESFELVHEAVQHQEGLLLLADHPRLLIGLYGRVEPRRLLAAISLASLRFGRARDPRALPRRNTHGAQPIQRAGAIDDGAGESPLDLPKTPPPARCAPAAALVDAARATGAAIVAVPDVYYADPCRADDHRVRVAIKHNALLQSLPGDWLAETPAHLPGHAELCAAFAELPDVAGTWPVAESARETDEPACVARTRLVAEACRYTPPLGGVLFPEVELEEGESPYSKLCALAITGAQARYRPLRPEVLRRLDYELATIQRLGFAPYFLLVRRIAEFARDQGIPSVGRGSAADSLVAYCLELTDADPFRYRLPFERFLNPTRQDRPDIDLDFCWRRRDEVLEHVFELFGHERTAMICTLNRFGLRSAFREAALAHGIPPAEISPWSARLPYFLAGPAKPAFDGSSTPNPSDADPSDSDPKDADPRDSEPSAAQPSHVSPTKVRAQGGFNSGAPRASEARGHLPAALQGNELALALAALPEARGFPFGDPRFVRTLQSAARLLDTPRHFGLHPGGVVVSPGPVTDFVSCHRSAKGPVVTQLDKDGVEAVGLVKMDLLGNRALTTLDDALGLLRERGVEVDLENLPEDDPDTAESLRRGRTLGCFQIESPGMRNLLQQMAASTMDDVIQAVALIRPGPAGSGMKDAYIRRARGLEDPTPPHPRLADVLWDTHGVMLYQEDVMQCAARVAGMDLPEADQLRRALQKRRVHEFDGLRERFLAGARSQGLGEPEALHVWDLAANFASFAFCKAHSVTYGRIAYRAAWLKTHYPAEYMTAFLLSETGYFGQRVYVEEARRLGVAILAPDVNRSELGFTLERRGERLGLRVGLAQAKGITGRSLQAILAARAEGPFLSLPDFLARTGARKDEALCLIRCGAFDAFDRTRPELAWRLHLLTTAQQKAPKNAGLDAGQLAACQSNAVQDARRRTPGWSGRGLGLGAADLAPGESAPLFPEPDAPQLVLPGLPDPSPAERGQLEFELLGLTLAAHPVALFPCEGEQRVRAHLGRGPARASGSFHSSGEEADEGRSGLRPVNPIPCDQLGAHPGARVTLKGWVAATRRVRTEAGELMRFLTLEDESGLAEAVLFPDAYAREGARLVANSVLLVTGVADEQLGSVTLTVERIW